MVLPGAPQRQQQQQRQPAVNTAAAAAAPAAIGLLQPGVKLTQAPEEYANVSQVRRRHRLNAMAILRQAMAGADYQTAAGAVATLLSCQREGLHRLHAGIPTRGAYEDLAELLWTALELLRQHGAAPETLKRTVRKLAALLADRSDMRQAAQLELVLEYWAAGDARQAADLLRQEAGRQAEGSRQAYVHHSALLSAALQHREWMAALGLGGRAAAGGGGGTGGGVDSGSQHAVRLAMLGPLQLPLATRAAAGRGFGSSSSSQGVIGSQGGGGGGGGGGGAAEAAARELERQLVRALGAAPAAALPTLLLCHLLVVSGRGGEAIDCARAAAAASGGSAESLALLALLLQPAGLAAAATPAAPAQPAGAAAAAAAAAATPAADAAAHEYVAACVRALQGDPWALGAVSGLQQAAAHCTACAAQAVRGLLLHLDAHEAEAAAARAAGAAAGPPGPLALPWAVLSVLLSRLAAAAVAEGTPAALAAVAAGGAAAPPLLAWLSLAEAFDDRQAWWPSAGLADPAELAPLLHALAQPPPQLQRQQQMFADDSAGSSDDGDGGGGGGDDGDGGSHDDRGDRGGALGEAHQQLLVCKAVALAFVLGPANAYSQVAAAELRAAAAAAAEAAAHSSAGVDAGNNAGGGGGGGGPLALCAAREALDDALALSTCLSAWQASLRQQQQQQQQRQEQQQQGQPPGTGPSTTSAGRSAARKRLLGGAPSAAFGAVLNPPDAWWTAFPHKRRQRQQRRQQHQEEEEEEQQAAGGDIDASNGS